MRKEILMAIAVLLLCLCSIGTAFAEDVNDFNDLETVFSDSKYVSTAGNDDNDGSLENPYLTIGKGISGVTADGTVYVADGTYYEHLVIDKNVNLVGQSQEGTIIDGSESGRPVTINKDVTVSISNFTIQNGVVDTYGGGGAISASGNININNTTFNNNTANGTHANGGAIFNTGWGTININNTTFNNNTANGTHANGGAIFNTGWGTININNTVIQENQAYGSQTIEGTSWGGAIYNGEKGIMDIQNSIIQYNKLISNFSGGAGIHNEGEIFIKSSLIQLNTMITNNGYGGGISNFYKINIHNSQINNNIIISVWANGGGIYNDGISSIKNSSLNNNHVGIENLYGESSGNGGGICNSGWLIVEETSISNNSAKGGRQIGGIINWGGKLEIYDSTINNNFGLLKFEYENQDYSIFNLVGLMKISSSEIINSDLDNVAIGGFDRLDINLSRIIGNLIILNHFSETHINLENNWWGSNDPDFSKLINARNVNDNVKIEYKPNSWLYLTLETLPNEIYHGQNSTLIASFNNAYDGTNIKPLNPSMGHLKDGSRVTFTTDLGEVGSQIVEKSTINGIATATLKGTENGMANVSAQLDEEEITKTVKIKKIITNLDLEEITSTLGSQVELKAVLKDSDNLPISGKTIKFQINDQFIGQSTTNNEGLATLVYTLSQSAGKHIMQAEFVGSEKYETITTTADLNVEKIRTQLKAENAQTTINTPIELTAHLTENNKPLEGKTIQFYKNTNNNWELIGQTQTNNQGIAKITHTPTQTGQHQIKTTFTEDQTHQTSQDTATLTINKITTQLKAENAQTTINTPIELTAHLTENNKPLEGKTIQFYKNTNNNWELIGQTQTNNQGIAKITHTPTQTGQHQIKTTFTEDQTHQTSQDTAILNVDKPEPVTGVFSRFMVHDAARRVRNFISNNGVLPNWVRMVDTTGITHLVTMPSFLELSTASLISNTPEFKAREVGAPVSPAGPVIVNRNLHKSDYLNLALNVNNLIRNNGFAPNSALSPLGNINYKALVDSFARIVAFEAENGVMPNYVVINTRRVR
ncbi:hypothetical protein JCM15415_12020 [Methanobacterium movens]